MTLETFKTVYVIGSILGTAVAFWLIRKERESLMALSAMTLIFAAVLLSFYFDAARGYDIGPMMEYAVHALVAVQPDIIVTVCNSLLWGTLPFGIALWLLQKKRDKRLVWVFFGAFTLLKTFFDDQFIIHQYAKILTHSFEWGYVFFDWAMIYTSAALFITKGNRIITQR